VRFPILNILAGIVRLAAVAVLAIGAISAASEEFHSAASDHSNKISDYGELRTVGVHEDAKNAVCHPGMDCSSFTLLGHTSLAMKPDFKAGTLATLGAWELDDATPAKDPPPPKHRAKS